LGVSILPLAGVDLGHAEIGCKKPRRSIGKKRAPESV
jgi:hypothetical protein